MKIFLKKGSRNYKEKRLLEALEPVIKKKMVEDADFGRRFVPANTYEELKALHDRFVPQEVDYEEVKTNINSNMSKAKQMDNIEDVHFENEPFVDPFNRENPKVRDYVLSQDPLEENITSKEKPNPFQKFDEPTNFDEAFEIPDFAKMGEGKKVQGEEETEKQSSKSKNSSREPLNPSFDEMSASKKKRSTKKFAKYIVETTTMLTEKGFVWYANKDITEAKLAEYELNGEIDLNLLLTLEDGQEATVRQFFQSQLAASEELLKITDEEKSDLIDALAEVMQEKGFAPTPAQELMLVAATIFGRQAITMFALKASTNNLLAQLRNPNQMRGNSDYIPPSNGSSNTIKDEIENDIARQQAEKQMEMQDEVISEYFNKSATELALSNSMETIE
jgi:hypothetical protein